MAVKVERIDACRWRIPKEGAMRTEGLVFASEALMRVLEKEQALEQVRNVATLPGIVGPSIAMPDIHWGYGFPIGGVAAFDPDEDGVVSPGGVGYDINCGVRLLRSALSAEEIRPQLGRLADRLYHNVPAGVGSRAHPLPRACTLCRTTQRILIATKAVP
jgi:tRNA-splicing ligase RtcB